LEQGDWCEEEEFGIHGAAVDRRLGWGWGGDALAEGDNASYNR
jgi:hypothetical protein